MFKKKKVFNDKLAINAIRATVIDITNKAKSGHPGMAIGSAPALYTLFAKHMVADPLHPEWINRDRFVLSAGHASALLYTILHLSGYAVSLEDLKSFRQIDSITPGHPEFGLTPGVDATAGPLAQGLAQAVGMAMAETMLSAHYPDSEKIMSHYTYALVGDGCLQEGLSQEAISFAGHQKLNRLVVLYDANSTTLDGPLTNSFSEDVKARFIASEWQVIEIADGNNIRAIDKALTKAKKSQRPTLIMYHSIIGEGSANAGTYKVHGNPLGESDGAYAKGHYQYSYPPFEIPAEVYDIFKDTFIARGTSAYKKYEAALNVYASTHEKQAAEFVNNLGLDINNYLNQPLLEFADDFKDSTRNTSGQMLAMYNRLVPNLVGGSADVAHSVMTLIPGETDYSFLHREGRNINFGIREFAMAAIQNGILLHGGLRSYVGCFLVFSDYMKNAIRMAAIEHLPAIFLFSHDSIAVGEDGPTHQPIEQLVMLRSIPHLNVIRPADARETAFAWQLALKSTSTPTALILSRQGLPVLPGSGSEDMAKGAYVIGKEDNETPDYAIIATGSEVSLALDAKKKLKALGIDVRVVSMPSTYLFDQQSDAFKDNLLKVPYENRVAVEMLSPLSWYKYAKTVMGLDDFGASAPAKDVIAKFDFTADRLVKLIKGLKK
ncbi:MAG: transketolase [Bacilli bacterium]|jgi:transketolase|nr:transketolase [Bacilli bacterium]MCH4235324.1 transketolase [Bacilli bacterium]